MFSRIACCLLLSLGFFAWPNAPPLSQAGAGYSIAGAVVDADTGMPIAHAKVAILPRDHPDANTAVVTGDDGQFEFPGLPAAGYHLRAQHQGYLTQSFEQHEAFATAIVVGPGMDSTHLVFPLHRECSIHGWVRDEAGEAVSDAQISLYKTGIIHGLKSTNLVRTASTDDEGFYQFGQLLPGRYIIAVSARVWYAQHPHPDPTSRGNSLATSRQTTEASSSPQAGSSLDVAYPLTFYPNITEPDRPTPHELKSGDEFEANISLQPVPAMHLHLNPENPGSRLTAARLEVQPFDAPGIEIFTQAIPDASGGIDLMGIAPGHYVMRISSGSPGTAPTMRSREIDVLENDTTETHSLGQRLDVGITLRFELGTALTRQGQLLSRDTATGKIFTLDLYEVAVPGFKQLLPPAVYEIYLSNASALDIKKLSVEGAVLRGRTVEIKGASPIKLTLTLGEVSTKLTGLTLHDGKPAAGIPIFLVPSDPAHNRPLFRADESDSDGTFTLLGVLPGEYTLVAIKNGWDLEWQNAAVITPYLSQGKALVVSPTGISGIKVNVP